jgi:hypothetical protein
MSTNAPDTTQVSSPLPGIERAGEETELQALFSEAHEFVLHWVRDRHGSANEFVQAMEQEFGSKVRMYLLELVREARTQTTLSKALREYLDTTLSEERLKLALGASPERSEEELSSLDELFSRSKIFRSSAKFSEAIDFVARFRKYSPYNNMLVYLQNPNATFWAVASHWRREFVRRVKDDARPMVILAPMTPVILVYDIADTEGDPLPDCFIDPFRTEGVFNEEILSMTIENCWARYCIQVANKKLGMLSAGSAIRVDGGAEAKVRIGLSQELDGKGRYSTLCHELAHIHLGHLGTDKDRWWPSRLNLAKNQREIEAEAVAYIVCRRAGLASNSAEYLAGYIKSPNDLERISIDLIVKVAGLIERMGRERLPARKSKDRT